MLHLMWILSKKGARVIDRFAILSQSKQVRVLIPPLCGSKDWTWTGTRASHQHPMSGGRAISWKRGQSLLFLNTVPGSQDPRYSVEMTGTSSTLTVTLVRREDAGQLICQVASKPPIEQSFSIEIKGWSSKQDQVSTTFI